MAIEGPVYETLRPLQVLPGRPEPASGIPASSMHGRSVVPPDFALRAALALVSWLLSNGTSKNRCLLVRVASRPNRMANLHTTSVLGPAPRCICPTLRYLLHTKNKKRVHVDLSDRSTSAAPAHHAKYLTFCLLALLSFEWTFYTRGVHPARTSNWQQWRPPRQCGRAISRGNRDGPDPGSSRAS